MIFKLFVTILGGVSFAQSSNELFGNDKITPGEIFSDLTEKDVCEPDFGTKARVPLILKREAYLNYELPFSPWNYKLNHKVPLILGGTNSIKNIWPEPLHVLYGAKEKEIAEDYLHKQVCQGEMDLAEAQNLASRNWVNVYKKCCVKKGDEIWTRSPILKISSKDIKKDMPEEKKISPSVLKSPPPSLTKSNLKHSTRRKKHRKHRRRNR